MKRMRRRMRTRMMTIRTFVYSEAEAEAEAALGGWAGLAQLCIKIMMLVNSKIMYFNRK